MMVEYKKYIKEKSISLYYYIHNVFDDFSDTVLFALLLLFFMMIIIGVGIGIGMKIGWALWK